MADQKPAELPSRAADSLPETIAVEDYQDGKKVVKVVNLSSHVVTNYQPACLKADGIISNKQYEGVIIIPFKK